MYGHPALSRLFWGETNRNKQIHGLCTKSPVQGNMLILLGFIKEYAVPSTSHYGTYCSLYVSLGNMLILLGFIKEYADPSTSHYGTY